MTEQPTDLRAAVEAIATEGRAPCRRLLELAERTGVAARDVGRVGKPLQWDPAAERFTNCDEANKLLERPRRKGYELPEIA